MLVLTRKYGEKIIIGNQEVVISIEEVSDTKVKIGIKADKKIPVHREEIYNKILIENKEIELFNTKEYLDKKLIK